MAAAIHTLVCGCVEDTVRRRIYEHGCWMTKAEAIAAEAIIANSQRDKPANSVAAALQALAEAGYLREEDDDDQVLFGVLDYLADTGLLGPADGAR